MGAVPLFEGELRVKVRLQHGVGQSGQDPGVDGLLVCLALVGDSGGLQGQEGKRIHMGGNGGTRSKPRRKRPLSVEHRHVGGTGERAYVHVVIINKSRNYDSVNLQVFGVR